MRASNPGRGPHSIIGPIAVRDAEPGDVVEIRYKRLKPATWGAVFNNPAAMGTGLLPQDFAQGQIKYVDLDLTAMQGQFAPDINIPLTPFQGTLGVAPPDGFFPPVSPGVPSSVPPGPHYALCSIGVSFRVTRVVDIVRGVHAMTPKTLFTGELRGQSAVVYFGSIRHSRESGNPGGQGRGRLSWTSAFAGATVVGGGVMRLEDKVALITGGASGMGASMARIFAREGAKVVVADVLDEEGKKVVGEITQANSAAMFRHLDVTSEAEWKATVNATVAEFGKLDILVNDAGLSGSAVEDLFDTAAWDRLMAVNARGVFLGMKFTIPLMKAAGGGSIVNISSISGITGQHGIHVGYNASKGAVRTLTKAAAVQHGADNIRVNSVHPGLMPPMRSSGRTADPEIRAKMLQQIPLRRAGRVEEVANAALFLASDEASYITGAELWVDGGSLAR